MSGNGTETGAPAEDLMRYDLLVEFALKQVVRMALQRVQRQGGLPGEHHFYIAFDTSHPGVRLSDRLRGKYPEEMTIVLQHQFWDLKVSAESFEVGLAFGGIPEKLEIPFDAVRGFFDPHVQFALQFHQVTEEEEALLRQSVPDGTLPPATVTTDTSDFTPAAKGHEAQPAATADEARADSPRPAGKEQKVVSLDAFRKKT